MKRIAGLAQDYCIYNSFLSYMIKVIFLSFDIEEVLNKEEIPAFKDAVVILGYLGDGNESFDIEDKHFTPLNSEWVGRAVPDTFGVIVHANILNMLSKGNMIYRVSKFSTYLLSFIVTYSLMTSMVFDSLKLKKAPFVSIPNKYCFFFSKTD